MDKSAVEALLGQLDGWAAFFALLVVLGVGGEFVVHVLASRASKRLHALEQREAESKQAEILQLSRAAQQSWSEVEQARRELHAAAARISDAEARAAEATARAAALERQAETERRSPALLEQSKPPPPGPAAATPATSHVYVGVH